MFGIDIIDGISDVAVGGRMIHQRYYVQGGILMFVSVLLTIVMVWARRVKAKADINGDHDTYRSHAIEVQKYTVSLGVSMCFFIGEVGTAAMCLYSVYEQKMYEGETVNAGDEKLVTVSLVTTLVAGGFMVVQLIVSLFSNIRKSGEQNVEFETYRHCAGCTWFLSALGVIVYVTVDLMRLSHTPEWDDDQHYDRDDDDFWFKFRSDDDDDDDLNDFNREHVNIGVAFGTLACFSVCTCLCGICWLSCLIFLTRCPSVCPLAVL
jgi:hypothetical protein